MFSSSLRIVMKDVAKVFMVSNEDRRKSNGFELEKSRFHKATGRNWFTNSVVDEWNKLSLRVDSKFLLRGRLDRFMDSDAR